LVLSKGGKFGKRKLTPASVSPVFTVLKLPVLVNQSHDTHHNQVNCDDEIEELGADKNQDSRYESENSADIQVKCDSQSRVEKIKHSGNKVHGLI